MVYLGWIMQADKKKIDFFVYYFRIESFHSIVLLFEPDNVYINNQETLETVSVVHFLVGR